MRMADLVPATFNVAAEECDVVRQHAALELYIILSILATVPQSAFGVVNTGFHA
jgi:hypothetical protein